MGDPSFQFPNCIYLTRENVLNKLVLILPKSAHFWFYTQVALMFMRVNCLGHGQWYPCSSLQINVNGHQNKSNPASPEF